MTEAILDAAAIAGLIPHAGRMCLLDAAEEWDATRIACRAASHRLAGNPLRRGGMLPAICGVEYAAQAMALHGALTGSVEGTPRAGYLASLREVQCHVARLDDRGPVLRIEAEQLMAEGDRVIYQFAVHDGVTELLNGRAAVVLEARS